MREHIKVMETELRSKKDQSEGIIERLREFTCNTLKMSEGGALGLAGWETSLTRALTQST
jgi:hypothetical protein